MSRSRPDALILLAGLLACGEDKRTAPAESSPVSADSGAPEPDPEADPTQVTLSTAAPVSLLVSALDLDGQPIEGASVSIDGQSARVDAAGNARIDGVAAWTEAAVVRISAPGHADLIRRLDPLDGDAVRVSGALPALEDLGWFDASESASIDLVPFEIELPAYAFATADGAVYEGRYHLSAQTWASHEDSADPDATFAASAPAPLLAPGLTDELDALESLGMLQVEVTDEAGSPLFLAEDQRATLKVDVSDVSVAPSTCTDGAEWWWTLDEGQGLWVPAFDAPICGEDQDVLVEDGTTKLVGQVSHFTKFNVDLRHTRGCTTVRARLSSNQLRGAEVAVAGPGYNVRVPVEDGVAQLLAIPRGQATARLYLYDALLDEQILNPGTWDAGTATCTGGDLTLGTSAPSGPGLIVRVRSGDCPATGGEVVVEDSAGTEITRVRADDPLVWADDLAPGTYTVLLQQDGVEIDQSTAAVTADQAEPTLVDLEGAAATTPPGGCLPLPCEGEDCNSCLSLSVTEDGLPVEGFPILWPETETSFITGVDGDVCEDLTYAADTHVAVALPDGTQGFGTLPRSANCLAETCLELSLEVGAGRTCPAGTRAWTAQSDWLGPTNPGTLDADQLLAPKPVTGGALALTVATTGAYWEESSLLQSAFGCEVDGLNCHFPGEVWSYEGLKQGNLGLMVSSGVRLRAGRRDVEEATGVSMDLGLPLSNWAYGKGQEATSLNLVFKGWEDGYGMPFTATDGTVTYEGQESGALVFSLTNVVLTCADPLCGDASLTLSGTFVAPRQTVASYPNGLSWLERRPQLGAWTRISGTSGSVVYGPSFAQDGGAALSVCLPNEGPWMFVGNNRLDALRPFSALQVWRKGAPALARNTTEGGTLLAQQDAIWVDRGVVLAELRRQGKDTSKVNKQAAILGLAMRCEDGACEVVTDGVVLLSSPSSACPSQRVDLRADGRQGAFAIVGIDPACATVDHPYVLTLTDSNGAEIPSFEQRVVPVAGGAMVVMREGLSRVYTDADRDGYGEPLTAHWGSLAEGGALTGDDCDDRDSDIHPGTAERPGDGVDQNCDGRETCYADGDADGYATDDVIDSLDADCLDAVESDAPGTDCDDADAAVSPGADEVCDGMDNNCDGVADEATAIDAVLWYRDGDSDGYGDPDTATVACDAPSRTTDDATDCDDGDALVYPGADEWCDGLDNNCNGSVDESSARDVELWYPDADGDGYGAPGTAVAACDTPAGYGAGHEDCNDADAAVNSGAEEVCDGVDNNCDFDVDGDAVDASAWYADSDGDGYGDPDAVTIACDPPAGYTADASDCEDSEATALPGGVEICDCLDNDCDGEIDEGGTPTVVYDAADEFSADDNPNGVWTYGWSVTLGSEVAPYNTGGSVVAEGIDSWYFTPAGGSSDVAVAGVVSHNSTSEARSASTVVFEPGQLVFHPGVLGEYSHVQFTPEESDGTYTVEVEFTGVDVVGTTTDVHVSVGGTSVFSDTIEGDSATFASTEPICVGAGGTIDFAVGYGTNLTYDYDTTALDVRISHVPVDGCE